MKTAIVITGIVMLLAIELCAAYAVLHPHMSAEYRAYYIDRTTNDWVPRHYPATPESGIVFGKPGWPGFVESTYGFSTQEDWGRWTDSNLADSAKIVFARQFSGPLCIEMVAHPSVAELHKQLTVTFGKRSQQVALSSPDLVTYRLSFDDAAPANTLEFHFENKVPRNDEVFRESPDPRGLGLALVSLKILPHACTSN
jgi:hypothetical protein